MGLPGAGLGFGYALHTRFPAHPAPPSALDSLIPGVQHRYNGAETLAVDFLRNVQYFGAREASGIGHSRAQKTWKDALDLQSASWQAVRF